jgi:hypothetical protein
MTLVAETTAVITITSNDEQNGSFTLTLKGYCIEKKFTDSDGAAYDKLGCSVTVSGDTVVVGTESGDAAYIYSRDQGGTDNWGLVKKLGGSGRFGYSVALSSDTLAVGAPFAGNQEGGVHMFYRDWGGTDNWGEVKYCVANDMDGWDNRFGDCVAISGDILLVGASRDTSGLMGYHGSVYVCYRDEGASDNWGIVKKLLASDQTPNGYFGTSVSISGDTVVVGAPGHLADQGAAYVFERNLGGTDNWGELVELTASDGKPGDRFGRSVAIHGDVIAVGAYLADSWEGSAYLFYRDLGGADNWGEAKKLPSSGDQFGQSVALFEDTLVIGAPNDSFGSEYGWGSISTFSRNRGGADNWGKVRKIFTADGAVGFGSALAISSTLLVAGAPSETIGPNTAQGSAYLCSP